MPHKDIILDGDSLANESMAGYLAAPTNDRPLLDLHKRPHLGVVPDGASVEVREIEDFHTLTQLDIRRDQLER
jgi:hypothetical protein